MNYVRFLCRFSFFLASRVENPLNISRVSPTTLSLVKCVVAFDVIPPPLGFFLSLWSDLLQIGKQSASASTSLSFGFGFGFIIIIHKSRLARIAIDRSLFSSFLWSSVPHDSSARASMTESWQSDWVGVVDGVGGASAPSEIEHNAKCCS